MKRNKLNQYESKSASEPSPEQIQQSKQTFVNLLTPVIEKMLKSPGDIKPVESFEELARQAKSGIVRQPTRIDSGETTKNNSVGVTKNDSGETTKNESGKETFSDEEKLILERLKNA
jgi:hypothetical protein